jgi:hypothetical protein
MPFPKKDEVESFVASLSEVTRKELEKEKTAEDRVDRAYEIVRAALASIAFPPPTEEELKKLYSDLSPDEKQRLDEMDPEDMRQELRRMYGFTKYRRTPANAFPGAHRLRDDRNAPPSGRESPAIASPK